MSGWKKAVVRTVAVVVALVAVGVPAAVGVRPFIGPKRRPLGNRTFQATPERLARGRYLTMSAQTPCMLCHSPVDTSGGTFKVKEGMEFAGRNWAPDEVPFVTAPI